MTAGRPGTQQPSRGFTAGSQQARSRQEGTQQALHIFFQEYSKDHPDELANTCVLLICGALADGILCWALAAGVLHADSGHWQIQCSNHAAEQAQAVHLQCKFLVRLVCQSHLPLQAVYDAVCANSPALHMTEDAVKDWLQC